jgi:biopolymer transport protein ExbB
MLKSGRSKNTSATRTTCSVSESARTEVHTLNSRSTFNTINALKVLAFFRIRRSQEKTLLSIIQSAGWTIWFIIFCSVICLAIIVERFWSLRRAAVIPPTLFKDTVDAYRAAGASSDLLAKLNANSHLGRIFASGLANVKSTREVMKESMERFLNGLGTIATVAPLLGLFGTVVGMIDIFGAAGPTGSDPVRLAQGISISLYNTAAGIAVAIPALIFYRHFRGRVDVMIVDMEQQGVKLVETLHGERK